jgi:hypothetical protein
MAGKRKWWEEREGLSPFWVPTIVMASRETLFPTPRTIFVLTQPKHKQTVPLKKLLSSVVIDIWKH